MSLISVKDRTVQCLTIFFAISVLSACSASGSDSHPSDPSPTTAITQLQTVPTPETTTPNTKQLASKHGFQKQFINEIMTLFKHSVWVLSDPQNIQETLSKNGFELVGAVIRGADHNSNAKEIWGVEQPPMSGGQAYVAIKDNNIVVVFRSTTSDDGWGTTLNVLTDLKSYLKKIEFITEESPNFETYNQINVHAGFHNEYLRYRDQIIKYIDKHPNKNIYVTGHSLGGALATLASFDLAANKPRSVRLYTYGSPRVGLSEFRIAHEEIVPDSYRVVIDGDPITRVPGSMLDYEHSGLPLQISSEGSQIDPEDIHSDAIFQTFDFPKHYLISIHKGLTAFYESCGSLDEQSINKCLNIDWMLQSALAERAASKKAWELVPKGELPWKEILLPDITVEQPKLNELMSELIDINLPSLEAPISLDKILDKSAIEDLKIENLIPNKIKKDLFK